MAHHTITEITEEKFQFTGRAKLFTLGLLLLGLTLMAIGTMQEQGSSGDQSQDNAVKTEELASTTAAGNESGNETTEAAGANENKSTIDRLWANLLMNSYYFFLFGVGALFFMAVNYVANAGWATLLKRIMEAVSSYVIIGFAILFVVMILAKENFYDWVEYFSAGYGPEDTDYDRVLESKSWLLNMNTFYFMVPGIALIWFFIRTKLRQNSLKEDKEGGLGYFRNSIRWSAGFIFFFAFSFSALSWIIIMSIDAHWYSTMFSVYNFAMTFVTGLTVMMMFLLYLKSQGYMELVSDEVVHDLGKFMFAFCIFWGYIFLGQWLLIWYANIPEETVYFSARFKGIYEGLFYTNIIMCFLLPFLILMMRNAKRNPWVLMVAGIVILVGHWIDVYLMVMPGTMKQEAGIGMMEIGTTMAFAGIFIFVVLQSLSRANLYPRNHPYALESANHDVGP